MPHLAPLRKDSVHANPGTTRCCADWSPPAWLLAAVGALLLWLAQPPIGCWPAAWVAVVPWLCLATRRELSRRDRTLFYFAAVIYWGVTMQGLRHAHPAMYGTWMLFAFYLACYSLAFVLLVRRVAKAETARLPLWIWVPIIGTGLECLRNYLLTGISAVMLGHSQVPQPAMIQIADIFGSYGVTFVILLTSSAIHHAICVNRAGEDVHVKTDAPFRHYFFRFAPFAMAMSVVIATFAYGKWRLHQVDDVAFTDSANTPSPQIALIGRDEKVLFVQDASREMEIFDAYFRQTIEAAEAAAKAGAKLDAIVWPESMYTGSLPWFAETVEPSRTVEGAGEPLAIADPSLESIVEENRLLFQRRGAQVQAAIRRVTGQAIDPDLIVGCSVVQHGESPRMYSGVVHLGARGKVVDWYGKTHLVMFGEYIPLINYLPLVHRFVPSGMGIEVGSGPVPMSVGAIQISPNICIETAVERVAPNHLAKLLAQGISADAIVNVTNDRWFNGTSIVEHHLRCSQMVAVTCRRPLLIAANGGPTAWIDGSGRIIDRLANEQAGFLLTNIEVDSRWGLYQIIGDWPARAMAALCIWLMLQPAFHWMPTIRMGMVGKDSRKV